jgi:hypothetical protein
MSEVNHYMMLYYDTCIKAEAEHRVVITQWTFKAVTDEEKAARGLKKPMDVVVRMETVRTFWLTESEETKEEVRASIESSYIEEKESWAAKQEVPKTAQEYHQ